MYRAIALCGILSLALLLPGRVMAVACSDIFSNAVGTTAGELELSDNVDLTNTGSRELATNFLDVNDGNDKCDGSACTASGSYVPTVSLPANSSTTSHYVSGTLTLAPGDHYFYDLILGSGDSIVLSGTGTVRIHVRDDLRVRNNATINAGGDANRLMVFIRDELEIDDDANIAGFFYAQDWIEMDDDAQLDGAIVGRTAYLWDDAEVDYVAPTTLDTDGWCTAGAAAATPVLEMLNEDWSGSGDTVSDSGSAGVDGTAEGDAFTEDTAPAASGSTGTCSYGVYDGNQDRIHAPYSATHNPVNFTLMGWAKVTGGSGTWRTLISSRHAPSSGDRAGFIIYAGSNNYWQFWTGSQGSWNALAGSAIVSDTWVHVAATFEATSSTTNASGRTEYSGVKRFYIDGVQVASATNHKYVPQVLNYLSIGGGRNNEPAGDYWFNGDIDEVRVFDAALDAATIGTWMNTTHPCPGSNTPYAEFRFEEAAGIYAGTAGEVVDTQGASTTAFASGTSSGVDTIAGGRICRGLDVPENTSSSAQWGVDTGIDIDDDLGNAGSITFWYRSDTTWNSGVQRMLMDASQDGSGSNKFFHVSITTDGRVRLYIEDTADSDLTTDTPQQSVPAATWKHIGVTWDLPGDTYRIYIDGTLVATGTANSNGAVGETQTLRIGDNRSNYHYGGSDNSAHGVLDEVRIYDWALTATEVLNDYNYTRACAVTSVDADGFNCIATGGDPLSGSLYLQKVATAFTFDVAALKDSDGNGSMDAVETTFASDSDRDVTVELVDASGGGACASRASLAPAVSQTLTFTAADAGVKAAAAMTVTSAAATVGCRVTDTTPDPDVVACSTDTFTVRPTALTLSTPTLDNSGASGTPMAAAGSAFGLSVVGGAGYDGTPKIDTAKVTAHTGAVATGTLAGGFGAAVPATGTASGTGFTYSEVGNFRFAAEGLYDDTFAGSDAANGDCTDDFSNSAVGGRFGCKFGNSGDTVWIGRFHPADFVVSVQNHGALADSCTAGGFSYQGQEVTAASNPLFRITARNAAGATTQNYTGSYRKLATADVSFGAVSGDGSQNGVDGITPVSLSWSTTGGRTLTDNADGTLDLALTGTGFTWGRVANDLIAPFTTDLDLDLTGATDADGVAATGLPVTASPTGVSMRYGRIALTNAYGSELQHLAVPMRVEYYLGAATGFVVHGVDTCTTAGALALTDPDTGDGLQIAETCVWDDDDDSTLGCATGAPAGKEYEPLPTAGLFNLHLMAPGTGNGGVLSLGVNAPDHLEFDWLGAGDVDPSARTVFGIYNRPSTIIYRREVR